MRVLLIEDDRATATAVQMILAREGCIVDATDLGEAGVEAGMLYAYDVILLDIMLPDIDGHRVLQRLRDARVQTPVLILSGLSKTESKLEALRIGADDYLTKPFDGRELMARIGALVRRDRGLAEAAVKIGRLLVDLGGRHASIDGRDIGLTRREFAILEILALRQGRPVSKETILEHLYSGMVEAAPKIVDVFVCKLRGKITAACGGERYIETVRGSGYQLVAPTKVPDMMTGHS